MTAYILHHVGVVDASTVISFQHSTLYPSAPSARLFRPIPFGRKPDPRACRQLTDLLTWNEYYYQHQCLSAQGHSEESIPFVDSLPRSHL